MKVILLTVEELNFNKQMFLFFKKISKKLTYFKFFIKNLECRLQKFKEVVWFVIVIKLDFIIYL